MRLESRMMTGKRRVLVVGADGADPKIVARMMREGQLPHLDALRRRGAWGALQTTFPPVSPVAWMTCLSGVPPRQHGIHDFITRAADSYLPTIALFNVHGGGGRIPTYTSRRTAPTLAEMLADAGKTAYILQAPGTFPPMPVAIGGVLAGFGMPDLLGTFGVSAWYTTDAGSKKDAAPEGRALVQPLEPVGGEVWSGRIQGPGQTSQTFVLHRVGSEAVIELAAGGSSAVRLTVGAWSNWLRPTFDLPGIGSIPGLCKFKLVALDRPVELYRTPLYCAPDRPLYPLTEPPEFGAWLQKLVGPFAATGMPADLDGVRRGVVDLDTFLQDAYANWSQQVTMALRLMAETDWDLIFTHLFTIDNVQHLFWHAQDPRHPAHTAQVQERYGGEIERAYRWIDAQLGRLVAQTDENTAVLVVSDHGGAPIYRLVYVNAWLRAQGYLEPREPDVAGQAIKLDWDRTQAAMFGSGSIWLNVQGRDPRGVTPPGAYDALRQEIAQRLLDWRDEDNGQPVVKQVLSGEAVFGKAARQTGPDLIPAFHPGYGLGRGEALGRVMCGRPSVAPNLSRWTGGHEGPYLPADVPGLYVLGGAGVDPKALNNAALQDVAPMLMRLLIE